jgi:mannose-6-phosphate isomerase-like protein (cupin superfamily)
MPRIGGSHELEGDRHMTRISNRSLVVVFGIVLAAAIATGSSSGAGSTTYLPASEVAAAFAKGRPLLEVDTYKIHASRREGPGQAEVHVRDTDIIYVLDGSATIVTGGTVVEPQTVAQDEVRGRLIDGGETRQLAKGDVLVVPNGVPHWFKAVQPPLLYYVVKVTATNGGTR